MLMESKRRQTRNSIEDQSGNTAKDQTICITLVRRAKIYIAN